MGVTDINLVVADLDRSRQFYLAWGCSLRAVTLPGDPGRSAWLTDGGPLPVSLHTVAFARWWDAGGPVVDPGSATLDVTVASTADADAMVAAARSHGGRVIAEPALAPWGQRYAIVGDPDGYRWGIKSPG